MPSMLSKSYSDASLLRYHDEILEPEPYVDLGSISRKIRLNGFGVVLRLRHAAKLLSNQAMDSVIGSEISTNVLLVEFSRVGWTLHASEGRKRATRTGGRASRLRVRAAWVSVCASDRNEYKIHDMCATVY
eukprot:6213997-Pleurochrysis_carterae.AAC.3